MMKLYEKEKEEEEEKLSSFVQMYEAAIERPQTSSSIAALTCHDRSLNCRIYIRDVTRYEYTNT